MLCEGNEPPFGAETFLAVMCVRMKWNETSVRLIAWQQYAQRT